MKIENTKIENKILELKNITKTFLNGKIIANNNINLSFLNNEIHSLVGENGSGKSTLMNIIFGLYKQDKGDIFINGELVNMYKSGTSKIYKIGMVHQHFHLIDNFTVLENVILGQEKLFNYKEEVKKVDSKIEEINLEINNLISDNQELKSFKKEIFNFIKKIKENNSHFINGKNILREKELELKRISSNVKNNHKIKKINKDIEQQKQKNSKYKLEIELLEKKINLYKDGNEENKIVDLINKLFEYNDEKDSNNLVGLFGVLNKKNLLKKFRIIQNRYKINIDPFEKVSKLSIGQRQMVEILKVLWEEKDLIVFDEPTATLSVLEIDELLKTVKKLKEEGKTIIFISHKLQEVKNISDRISILRKGELIGTYINDSNLEISKLGEKMVGKKINLFYKERKIKGDILFEFKNISYRTRNGFKALDNVSFSVRKDEIFGIAGVEGNGQEEIIKIISGLRKPENGEILYKNEEIVNKDGFLFSSTEKRNIISHIPIDRLKYGVVPTKQLDFNARISDYDTNFFSKKIKTTKKGKEKGIGFDKQKLKKFTSDIIDELRVDGAFSHSVEIRNLSGGNQQKFVVGRELLRNHEIIVAGHPTRGLDIASIDHIYKKIIKNSKNKVTILYSLEISELVAICDRLAIMYKGKIVDIVNPREVELSKISKMMIGEVG